MVQGEKTKSCAQKNRRIFYDPPVFLFSGAHEITIPYKKELFFLMSVFSQTLFAFVSSHFMSFSFFTAWHSLKI
jgi:hypothetical protein